MSAAPALPSHGRCPRACPHTTLPCRLQVALYHRAACEAASEDMLLELADWAYRKLAYLNSDGHAHAAATAKGEGPMRAPQCMRLQ